VDQVPRASVQTTVSSVVDVDLRSLQILKLCSAKSTGCKTETMIKIKTIIEKHSLICVLKQLFLAFYDSLNVAHVLCPLQNDLFHFAVAFCGKNNDGQTAATACPSAWQATIGCNYKLMSQLSCRTANKRSRRPDITPDICPRTNAP